MVPAQSLVAQHLVSFQQFPPRQKPGSFSGAAEGTGASPADVRDGDHRALSAT